LLKLGGLPSPAVVAFEDAWEFLLVGHENDRNLLIAVLAVQLKGLSPERVMEIAMAWSVDPSKSLAQHLQDRNLLSSEDADLLVRLAGETVAAFGDDAERALDSIAGGATMRRSIAGVRPRAGQEGMPIGGNPPYDEAIELSGMRETPGRYSHISEYARGGMGRVLLVHDAHLGRDIALKELLIPHDRESPSPAISPMRESGAALERFLQEARITGQLEHPSIVPVYELGRRDNGTLYYTMRLVRGDTMSVALANCQDLQCRLGLLKHLIDLCQALAYAHSRGVIHRDIKPSNVMIGEFGETVLLDWGLAKARGHEDLYEARLQDTMRALISPGERPLDTREGAVIGTPHYMPPEQAEGLIEALDERSDIYAAGAVLYEMLAGKPPYAGTTTAEIISHVRAGTLEALSSVDPELPPELMSICQKCMARDPQQRYASMKEVASELIRFQTGAFVQSYRYTAREIMRRWYIRHRLALNTASAAVLVLLAAGVAAYVSIWNAHNREHAQRLVAEEARSHEAAAREQASAARDRMEDEHDHAQRNLAQAHRENQEYAAATKALWRIAPHRRDWAWGLLLNACNPDLFTILENGTIQYAGWHPDGTLLITITGGGPPKLWKGETGELVRTFENGAGQYGTLRFSGDGSLFAATSQSGVVTCWAVDTGRLLSASAHAGMTMGLAFDTLRGWVWAGYSDGFVRAIDYATGDIVHAVALESGPVGILEMTPGGGLLLAETNTGQILAYDLEQDAVRYTVPGTHMRLSPTGKHLFAVSEGQARLLEPGTGAITAAFEVPAQGIHGVQFSASETLLTMASFDGWANVAEITTGNELWRFPLNGPVSWSYFLEDGAQLLAGGQTNQYSVFDLTTGGRVVQFAGEGTLLSVAEVTPNGRRLLSVPATRHVQVFDAARPTGVERILQHEEAGRALTGVVACPQRARFAASWLHGSMLIYDAELGPVATIQTAAGMPARAAFFPDGEQLAYVGDGYAVFVLDVATGEVRQRFDSDEAVRAVAVDPTGDHVYTGGVSGAITQWHAVESEPVREFSAESPVNTLVFTAEGNTLVSGHADGAVRFWDSSSGNVQRRIEAHAAACAALAFTSDGTCWASLGSEDVVHLWDATTHERLRSYGYGGGYGLYASLTKTLDFSEDGRLLSLYVPGRPAEVIGVETADVVFRDEAPGTALIALPAHQGALRFARDGHIQRLVLPDRAVYEAQGEAAHELYRKYKMQRPAWTGNTRPARAVAMVNTTHLADALAYLARLLAAPTPADTPVSLEEDPLPPALQDVALRTGDTITGMNGTPWPSRAAAQQAVTAVTASAGGDAQTVILDIERGGHALALSLHALPRREKEVSLTMDIESCRALLAFLLGTLEMGRPSGQQLMWIPGHFLLNDTQELLLAKADIFSSDIIVSADGIPLEDEADAVRILRAWNARIETGESLQIRFGLNRGLGLRINLNVQVP
jgi:serine/threonine protein kinase/WD40 repeat protein